MLKLCKLYACENGTLGVHLSRAPWDPYPWVSGIQETSSAHSAGIRAGDSVLEVNGCDILGQKISEIAVHLREHWLSGASYVTVTIWRNKADNNEDEECSEGDCGETQQSINQQSLQKFATCLQHIAQLLECPVCLEVIKPPGWQCCNGHVLCNNCRSRSIKCPVCRVPLGPRGRCLLSDKLFTVLAESFPCDGVRSNKNSPNERPKCSPAFHNHPKMAAATMQQENKAKEIRKKVKTLSHLQDDGNIDKHGTDIFVEGRAEIAMTKRQAAKEDDDGEAHNKTPTNANGSATSSHGKDNNAEANANGSMSFNICSGETSQTTKVHHQQGNEMKILKSHEDKQFSEEKSEFTAAAKPAVSTETSPRHTSINGPLQRQSLRNNNATSSNNNGGSVNNKHVLVKLKLKSSKKAADYNEPRVDEITGQASHELQDDEVTIVNNGMPTNKVPQEQQEAAEAVHEEESQQYQNYHCPTGKSCCNYVETCTAAAAMDLEKLTTPGAAVYMAEQHGDHAVNEKSKLSTTRKTNEGRRKSRPARTVGATLMATAAVALGLSSSKLSSRAGSTLSCNKISTPELQLGANTTKPTTNSQITLALSETPTVQSEEKFASRNDDSGQKKGLTNEWDILFHLTRAHSLAIAQFYGTYGQSMRVDFIHSKSMACLNLIRRADQLPPHGTPHADVTNNKMDKFFLACIPYRGPTVANANPHGNENGNAATVKYAIFLWQLPVDSDITAATAAAKLASSSAVSPGAAGSAGSPAAYAACDIANATGDVRQFVAIIESKRTGIKWFGRAHPLTKSWPQICAEGHFLMHELPTQEEADAFDIVIKIK